VKVQFGSELTKVASTKLWWLVLTAMAVLSTGFTAFIVFVGLNAPRSPLHLHSADKIAMVYNLPATIAYVFPLAFGVLTVTQEYNSRTIVNTFLGEPRKHIVYSAKFLLSLCVAFLYAVVCVGLSAAVAAAMMAAQGTDAHLTDPKVVTAILGSIAVLTLWGPIGVGIGALLRNQVVAIVGIVLATRFIEPLVRLGAAHAGYAQLGTLLPGGAGDVATGGTIINAAAGMSTSSPALGFLVLGGYAVVFALAGRLRFTRYEVC
jgi:ABC-2 type transport system permease protein